MAPQTILTLLALAAGGNRAPPSRLAQGRPFAPRRVAAPVSENVAQAVWPMDEVPESKADDYVDRFCRWVNTACRATVVAPVQSAVALRPATNMSANAFFAKALSPPELPPISRQVSFVIAASVPTLLVWYGYGASRRAHPHVLRVLGAVFMLRARHAPTRNGPSTLTRCLCQNPNPLRSYYKFSTEEELFWEELRTTGRATGCGGYGTLFPFVYAFLLGGAGQLAGVHGAETLVEAGGAWILAGQVNLYRRVNELCVEAGEEEPLHAWWALLPPPLDVIVGLRQLHFLAKRNAAERGEAWEGDAVAERLFPFISSPRFTLKELARSPRRWFWFTADAPDFEWEWLQEQKK